MTLALTCLSDAMPEFLSRYPDLSINLHMDDRRVDVVRGGYDVVIRGSDKLEDSSLIARKLMTLRHVVCGAPAYFERRGVPETPDELRNHECIQFTLSGHADEWTFAGAGRSVRIPIDGRYKVTSSLAVRDALRAGFGLSLVPWLYVRSDIEQGRLRTVLNRWTSVETGVYAVYPSRRHGAAKVRAFLDFIAAELEGAAADSRTA